MPKDDDPPIGGPNDGADPIAQMAQGAQAFRNLFNSYVLTGFTEAQAIYLVGVMLNAMVKSAISPPGVSSE